MDEKLQFIIQAVDQASKTLNDVNKVLNSIDDTSAKVKKTNESLSTSVFKGMAGWSILSSTLTAVGRGLLDIGKQAVESAGRFEQTKIAYSTLLGSVEKANTVLRDLAKFAQETPFELKGVQETGKFLLAMGFTAQELIPTMRDLGNATMGNQDAFQRASVALGQVRQQGRLMGQDLMQFTNANIPLISELAKNLKTSEGNIKSMVSEGKIGFNEVSGALKSMSSEGGRFFELMDKQSKTLLGRISNLKDGFDTFLQTQGAGLNIFVGMFVDGAKKVVDWLNADAVGANNFGKALFRIGNVGVAVVQSFNIVVQSLQIVGKAFVGLIQTILGFGTDVTKVLGGIAGKFADFGQGVLQALTFNFEDAGASFKKVFTESIQGDLSTTKRYFSDFTKSVSGNASSVVDSAIKVGKALDSAVNLTGFNTAVQKYGELGEIVKDTNNGMSDSTDKTAKKLKDNINDLIAKYKELGDKTAITLQDLKDAHNKNLTSIEGKMDDLSDKALKVQEAYFQSFNEIQNKIASTWDSIRTLEQEFNQQKEADTKDIAKIVVDSQQEMSNLQTEISKATNEEEKAEKQKQLKALSDAFAKYNSFISSISAQVTEQTRRAGLTELERAIEDFQTKRQLAQQEFDDKREKIRVETQDLINKRDLEKQQYQGRLQDIYNEGLALDKARQDEINLYAEKTNTITDLLKSAMDNKAKLENDSTNITIANIKRQVEAYDLLAKAITNSSQGKTTTAVALASSQAGLTTTSVGTGWKAPAGYEKITGPSQLANYTNIIDEPGTINKYGKRIPGRATGGDVNKGEPYIVGEDGQELFIPKTDGSIVPNNKMNKVGNNMTLNINVNGNFVGNEQEALKMGNIIINMLKRTGYKIT